MFKACIFSQIVAPAASKNTLFSPFCFCAGKMYLKLLGFNKKTQMGHVESLFVFSQIAVPVASKNTLLH
jgi:hypothetical protein